MPSPHAVAASALVHAERSILRQSSTAVTNDGSLPHLLQRGVSSLKAEVAFSIFDPRTYPSEPNLFRNRVAVCPVTDSGPGLFNPGSELGTQENQKGPLLESKGTIHLKVEWKGATTAFPVLAELGHSQIQNRPLK